MITIAIMIDIMIATADIDAFAWLLLASSCEMWLLRIQVRTHKVLSSDAIKTLVVNFKPPSGYEIINWGRTKAICKHYGSLMKHTTSGKVFFFCRATNHCKVASESFPKSSAHTWINDKWLIGVPV